MSLTEVVNYVLLALPAALALFFFAAAVSVFLYSYRRMVAKQADFIDIGAWVACMVAFVLNGYIFAGMGISAFERVFGDRAQAIAWVFTSILAPLFSLKAIQKWADSKGGTAESTVEKTTEKTVEKSSTP